MTDTKNKLLNWMRRPMVAVAIVIALVVVAIGVTARGLLSGKVILGKAWPESELVSIDEVDHGRWDELLHRHVDAAGGVDYAGWKASREDMEALDTYLRDLSRANPELAATLQAKLAFWTNAYNAVTVRGILREYPTKSIRNHVSRLLGYDIWRDLLLQVGTQRYSLGEMEHAILRKMDDPRIHFAIVCGSKGCPVLRKEAYDPGRMEDQLRENASRFFADPTKFSYDPETRSFRMSPILDWYAEDFGHDDAERMKAIAPYLPDPASRDMARQPGIKLSYPDYDWGLNDQSTQTREPPLPPGALRPPAEESP